jgi:hypothetical protein
MNSIPKCTKSQEMLRNFLEISENPFRLFSWAPKERRREKAI